jgi:hypothetical protein
VWLALRITELLSVVGAANIGSAFVRVRIVDGSYVIRFDREFLFVIGPIFGFKCDLRAPRVRTLSTF